MKRMQFPYQKHARKSIFREKYNSSTNKMNDAAYPFYKRSLCRTVIKSNIVTGQIQSFHISMENETSRRQSLLGPYILTV